MGAGQFFGGRGKIGVLHASKSPKTGASNAGISPVLMGSARCKNSSRKFARLRSKESPPR